MTSSPLTQTSLRMSVFGCATRAIASRSNRHRNTSCPSTTAANTASRRSRVIRSGNLMTSVCASRRGSPYS
ncbi:Uncharacterised protein [Mycobacterium tuberculosis]|uniref:Uncharacterized protein n=1 Tax=Mycobacterium tuberculosis TaxID=1773 RepID=A0A0U0URN2_MYCTX|nr:Uncharacterised protein [Mycobacterium tuberculosis]CPB23763.1 Uncharacterised protein [Mycobacterium tuberculosis]